MAIIKQFLSDIFSIVRSLYITFMHIFNKRETQLYPEIPVTLSSRYRGRIILTRDKKGEERCVACGLCSAACPVDCIAMQQAKKNNNRWYAKMFRINFSRCIFCGLCEEACPTLAIQLIPDFELAEYRRQDLVYEKEDLLVTGSGKNLDYDFYQVSGINLDEDKFNSDNKKNDIVDVKKLLP